MNRTLSLVILCTFAIPCISFAQEYSYTHYGITEGLAGSTVYCITQDKDGFIWTGTETGVSRFDGTHFKNFTTKDGLPDLEILMIFGDSKGRVWMAPFRKSVCYYYKGRIYNQENDPFLARIRVKENVEGFAEDADGNILIQERNVLHQVGADSSLIRYDSLDGAPVRNCLAASRSSSGHFLAEVNGRIIEFSGKKSLHSISVPVPVINSNNIAMNAGAAVWSNRLNGYDIQLFSKKGIIRSESDRSHVRQISVSILDDSLVYSNELLGSLEYNIHTGKTRTYLRGRAVSRVFRDASGDLWFTTMGEGIFRLNSNEWKTISLVVEHAEKSSVTAINMVGNELWIGENHNYIFRFSLPNMILKSRDPCFIYMARRILFMDTIGNNAILVGGDNGLAEGTRSFHYLQTALIYGLKSAVRIDDRRLLLSSAKCAGIFDLRSFQFTDTLWRERATVVFHKEDTNYVGTQNGLYRSVKGQSIVFLGESTPFLRKRISAIAESPDGIVWIASSDDAGIIGYKNGRQVAAITRRQGLTSDICRTLLVHNNVLWVGTDKGLNRIELDKPEYHVIQYTSRDGLASDMVNIVFIDHSRVYVGTSAGLCFFDDRKMANREECRLYLLSLINSERDRIADTAKDRKSVV